MLLLAAFVCFAPKTVTLVPKETVWVYENASSPADGTFLRAWGAEGKSWPAEGEDAGQFSCSYLKWDLSDIPAGAILKSAKLEFFNIANPGFTVDSAKKTPLEARAIAGAFDAKTWTFDMLSKVHPAPGATAVYGSAYPKEILNDAPVPIAIDLMAGPNLFEKLFKTAVASPTHQLSLSITSAIDPSAGGRSAVYKLYGQTDAHENLRPRLTLTFEF